MDTSHAERRALFDDLPDLGGDGVIDGLAALPRTRLVAGRGTRHDEQSASASVRLADLRRQSLTFGFVPSGKVAGMIAQAFGAMGDGHPAAKRRREGEATLGSLTKDGNSSRQRSISPTVKP